MMVNFQARAGKREAFLLEAFFFNPSKSLGMFRSQIAWE